MILLDTNVLSALMNDIPDPAVVDWLDNQAPEQVWTTAITVFEVRLGLSRLPPGRKRRGLEAAFSKLIHEDLADRVSAVDRAAADAAGVLAASREAAGRPVDMRDTLIAGIAIARRATIATRNIRHFNDLERHRAGSVDGLKCKENRRRLSISRSVCWSTPPGAC